MLLPDLVDAPPDVLDWQVANRLMAQARKVDEWAALVFDLFLHTGVRRTEAARLKFADLDCDDAVLTIRGGKRRPRSLPAPEGLVEVMALLVQEVLGWPESDYLFPGEDEDDRADFITRLFRRWSVQLKEPRWHAHALRHTFASELARQGVNENTIGRLLGHSQGGAKSITSRYIQVHAPELKAAMALLWPVPVKEDRRAHFPRVVRYAAIIMGGYSESIRAMVRQSRPGQWFVCHVPFLGIEAGHRVCAIQLRERAKSETATALHSLSVESIGGRACLMQGSLVVLVPMPEYIGGRGDRKLKGFDLRNLAASEDVFDQLDSICLFNRLRLVICRLGARRWRAEMRSQPSVGDGKRWAPHEAATAEAAILSAISSFREVERARIDLLFSEPAPMEEPRGTGVAVATHREAALEARLMATLAAVRNLGETAELDDGKHVLVKSARLSTLLGVMRRNHQDLEQRSI